MGGQIAVAVSGSGSNLRALAARIERGALDAEIALVFADRPCVALTWAEEAGFETAMIPDLGGRDPEARAAADAVLAQTVAAAGTDAVVLAGFMRLVGPILLGAFPGRVLNVHPSLLPAFPGAHAVRDALAAGAAVTGVTVHVVDASLDGGPVVLAEAVPVLGDDTEETLLERLHAVEHRLLPRAVGLLLAGALRVAGRRVTIDAVAAAAGTPMPRRALLSVSDKAGLVPFASALVARGFELVSTGGTARALREAGLPVTDVAAVTGFPEMLDGRVKTLHPRVHGGILADGRLPAHRYQLAAAGIEPFELVVVNLYPFAAAAERALRGELDLDGLVEEIDIGGPSMVRAAAKNHASVAIVTDPGRYGPVLAALDADGAIPAGLRAALAVEAFRHTAAYDARIAEVLPERMAAEGVALPEEPGLPGAAVPFPARLTVTLELVETLRYGENPHQPAARYRRPGATAADGPFATGAPPLQGKALSYNNVLDGSAAAGIARLLRGPACVIVKHTNPCGAAERNTLAAAWDDALAADPVSAFGGVVALTRPVDRTVAERLASIFLEVVVAPSFEPAALEVLSAKPNLRLVVDPALGADAPLPAPSPTGSLRTAGGAVLVTAPDTAPDDPATWTVATRRAPSEAERRDLDLAWRLVRGVTSNAIVLVRDGMLIGIGSGQTSRVDAARQAVAKATALLGADRLVGAACASDAFYPFPDAVEVCLDAGVSAFAQPGGSLRDADAVAAADTAGATMLLTGVRHFR
ncbi:MAG TPA: bifunctional phosphoribosylaminoimidazolecarboxamide formyltransferase/IMP cyclohydrolase, partial [Patescibacteria group bacterium]|nr:bifunctional phosphoribosylaminoimidazolecarboxamide formyltransferase/IMP cyclohydrolase [Patescibacteria group bacterium]